MQKEYQVPEIEVIALSNEDVITTSNQNNSGSGSSGSGAGGGIVLPDDEF